MAFERFLYLKTLWWVVACIPVPTPLEVPRLGTSCWWQETPGHRQLQLWAILPHWSFLHSCRDLSGTAASQRFGDTGKSKTNPENLLWLLCVGTSKIRVRDVPCPHQPLSRGMACRGQGRHESLGREWKQQLFLAGRRRTHEGCDSQSPMSGLVHGP